MRSIVQTADMSVEVYLRNIREEAAKVDDLARLIDAECKVCSTRLSHDLYSHLISSTEN